MIAYKFLHHGGVSVFTGFQWPLPSDGPGPWVEAEVEPCRSGVHACRLSDLPLWLADVMYEVELDGQLVEQPTKVIASRARLVRHVAAWDDDIRNAYTRMCADRAHDLARGATPPLDDWDAVVAPSMPEGPALLGFIAARIAEKIDGVSSYRAERTRQADWLADHLRLRP